MPCVSGLGSYQDTVDGLKGLGQPPHPTKNPPPMAPWNVKYHFIISSYSIASTYAEWVGAPLLGVPEDVYRLWTLGF